MNSTGRLKGVSTDFETHRRLLTFEVDYVSDDEINRLYGLDKLDIKADKRRKKRSLDANALLWHCLGQLAAALQTDKWSVYLLMLKRYGKYTFIVVKKNAVEAMKRQWRECEEIGEIDIHGEPGIQLLCYFGSSTYDSKEFSVLLDGVKDEMEQAGIEPPASSDMRRVIEALEKEE